MGGGSSTQSTLTDISQNITNIAMSTVQNCVVTATEKQSNITVNSGLLLSSSTNEAQSTSIASTCFQDAQLEANLQNQIINTIAQTNTSTGLAVLGAFGNSSASSTANLTNIVKSNVTLSNIQNNYNALTQNQSNETVNVGVMLFSSTQMTQGATIFAAATLQAVENAQILNTISNYLTQQNSATQSNPLDFISNLLNSLTSTILIYAVIFILIICAVVVGAYTLMHGEAVPSVKN